MVKRSNVYEMVFEEYLRERGLPYIAVREELRPVVSGRSVKNLDFIVTSPNRENALIDVKGKTRSGSGAKWENWLLADDLEGLEFWEKCFGRLFVGLVVFVYELASEDEAVEFEDVRRFENKSYGMLGITCRDYRDNMKVRSAKWNTRSVPSKIFRTLARPVSSYL